VSELFSVAVPELLPFTLDDVLFEFELFEALAELVLFRLVAGREPCALPFCIAARRLAAA